jgi:hypothetical protein
VSGGGAACEETAYHSMGKVVMSIRRIISTGIISSALVLSSGTAALANTGPGGEGCHLVGEHLLALLQLLRGILGSLPVVGGLTGIV